jgi:hypothetical protein
VWRSRWCRKLLAFNDPKAQRVEVVILSRNDPVSGMRVFRSAQAYGMPIQRGVFTRGGTPWRYLKPLAANLFLSANEADVRSALEAGVPAARVFPHSARASDRHPQEVRIAFDGDAVLFSDEAERVFQESGLDAFQAHERAQAETPLAAGPFQPLLLALHRLQNEPAHGMRIRTALVTARSAPAHERAIRTLMEWNVEIDEAMFLGGLQKGRVPARVRARLLLRRPDRAHRERVGARAFGPRRVGRQQPAARLTRRNARGTARTPNPPLGPAPPRPARGGVPPASAPPRPAPRKRRSPAPPRPARPRPPRLSVSPARPRPNANKSPAPSGPAPPRPAAAPRHCRRRRKPPPKAAWLALDQTSVCLSNRGCDPHPPRDRSSRCPPAAPTKRASSRLPRLLDEAARAFAQRGFAAASVREIVEPVGMLPARCTATSRPRKRCSPPSTRKASSGSAPPSMPRSSRSPTPGSASKRRASPTSHRCSTRPTTRKW